MKKLILIISVILSFGIVVSPSYAKKGKWGDRTGVKPRYTYVLTQSYYNSPYQYCIYAVYENEVNGALVKYERREIPQPSGIGCPK